MRVSCIDIGTFTCRLAIAEVEGGRVESLRKQSVVCDLGEGLAATGRLSGAAVARVVSCAEGFVRAATDADVVAVCCTLTSAARDAANAGDLVSKLTLLGLSPQVIPGDVEGTLTFYGVASDHPGRTILVADNGGGSTELAAGTLAADGTVDLAYVESVDVGCRRLTDRFLSSDVPDTPQQVAAARSFAYAQLAPAVARAFAAAPGVELLVTCGGTVTSLVAIRDSLVPYDASRVHGATLTLGEVERQVDRLASMGVGERAGVAGLQAERAPVIVGGMACVLELLRATGMRELSVSEHDLLYGLALVTAGVAEGLVSPVPWVPTLSFLTT